jgi:hypothetical protein
VVLTDTNGAEPTTSIGVLEEISGEPVQMSGRTDGDQIVLFEIQPGSDQNPESLIGSIVRVQIGRGERLSLHGKLTP